MQSIGNSISKVYEETKGDIEKVKNIPINIGIIIEDYYNDYILKEEKEQEKWKNISKDEFIKINEGRVWYFDTIVGENINFGEITLGQISRDLTGHAGLYFIYNNQEYMIDFYTKNYQINYELLTNKPLPGENWASSGQENTSLEILRNQIQGIEGEKDKERFIIQLKGNNFDINKIAGYYNLNFGSGNNPDYKFLTDNCSSEVENALRVGGYFDNNNIIDIPLKLRKQIMIQELKNKFIGDNY